MSRFVVILPWLPLLIILFGLLLACVYSFVRALRKDVGWQKMLSAIGILFFGCVALLTLAVLGAAVFSPPLEPKDPVLIEGVFEKHFGRKPDTSIEKLQVSYYPNWPDGRVFIQFQTIPTNLSNITANGFSVASSETIFAMIEHAPERPVWWQIGTNQSATYYSRTGESPAALVVDSAAGTAAYYRPPLKR